jgi:hypothetical protein
MVFTDGTNSTFAVMVGPMRGKYFNASKAARIATYNGPVNNSRSFEARVKHIQDFERELTAKHATPQAPPVPWQA